MPPKGKLRIGTNIGIDKDRAFRERIEDLEKSQVREIPLALIDQGQNVRTSSDEEGLRQLAASIDKLGLLQPVLLSESGTRYVIQAGHRRVLAYRLLARDSIPSILRPTAEDLAEIQLIENIQREDLSPADLEQAVKGLVQRLGSQDKVAHLLMKSKQWVSNILAASRVRDNVGPALKAQGVGSAIPSSHLRDIARLPAADQVRAAQEALQHGGGKRAFRQAAGEASPPGRAPRTVVLRASLTVLRQPDGTLSYQPEIAGEAGPNLRPVFDDFCNRVRRAVERPTPAGSSPKRTPPPR